LLNSPKHGEIGFGELQELPPGRDRVSLLFPFGKHPHIRPIPLFFHLLPGDEP